MEAPPTKKAKGEASIRLTKEQRRLLEHAAVYSFASVDADDPFSLLLLDAIQNNPNCTEMNVKTSRDEPPRKFLDALAHFLVSYPYIEDLTFRGTMWANGATDWAMDDYSELVTAMIRSQSLRNITMEYAANFGLEEAIIEVLKWKLTDISLTLADSPSFIDLHPNAFGEMLATTKCLSQIVSFGIEELGVFDQYDRTHIQDGLGRNQSLRDVRIASWHSYSFWICPDGYQNLERLRVDGMLELNEALLLNKLISNHKKLAWLDVHVTEDAVEGLCEAVSCSRSLRALTIEPYSHESAISQMLQQTTSLQELFLGTENFDLSDDHIVDFKKLAVGLEGCKTLMSVVSAFDLDLNGARALLKVAISKHNLKEIILQTVIYHDDLDFEKQCEQNALTVHRKEILFYSSFNHGGRVLLQMDVPLGLWSHALAKAGSSSLPDALYFFLKEMPVLVMHHVSY